VSPAPDLPEDLDDRLSGEVFDPMMAELSARGMPYVGVLYAGLVLTTRGPMVLEFNARFGDPEAQVLLPLLDGDLASALIGCAIADRGLMEDSVSGGDGAAVGVVVASAGYPELPVTGRRIEGAEPSGAADGGDLLCFHAGTRRTADGEYETAGGRIVTMVGRGPTVETARETAYRGIAGVALEGGQYRTDVAARESDLGDRPQLGDQAG
ncbi:MAG: phosphoribosylglycinamide synthetase C domain-containing protein, partial [Candidatus Limnocylindria bacterium]